MKNCLKSLAIALSALAVVFLCASCFTTPKQEHVYDFGDENEVSQLPHTRPESFEGNPFGSMPQSR